MSAPAEVSTRIQVRLTKFVFLSFLLHPTSTLFLLSYSHSTSGFSLAFFRSSALLQVERAQDELARIQVDLLEHMSAVIAERPANPLAALAEELLSASSAPEAAELLKAVDWGQARALPLAAAASAAAQQQQQH